eukprot:scaffold699_cov95-Cylindrotheca_fusiformis.AAC.3
MPTCKIPSFKKSVDYYNIALPFETYFGREKTEQGDETINRPGSEGIIIVNRPTEMLDNDGAHKNTFVWEWPREFALLCSLSIIGPVCGKSCDVVVVFWEGKSFIQ